MKPKIIHTKTFSCADDHPIVYYTFGKDNKAMCHYCAAQFVYEPEEDWWKRHKSYIDHRKEFPYYPEKNKKKSYSEEMQDKIEPIDHDHVNKVLKGSG